MQYSAMFVVDLIPKLRDLVLAMVSDGNSWPHYYLYHYIGSVAVLCICDKITEMTVLDIYNTLIIKVIHFFFLQRNISFIPKLTVLRTGIENQ